MADSSGLEFHGPLRPGGTRSLRLGIVAGVALTVLVGALVAMGAAPGGGSPITDDPPALALESGALGTNELLDEAVVSAPLPATGWLRPDGSPAGPFGLGRGRGHVIAGKITITAISGSNLSLRTEDGWTRTITVTSATTITKAGQTIGLADLRVGDEIRFAQQRNSDGTYTITRIVVVVPKVAGVVTGLTDATITITTRGGLSETIRTTASTTYRVGDAAGSRSDVAVGSAIVAFGERASDGTLTATTVVVALPRVGGTVSAKTSDSLTLERRDGTTVVVHVSSSTKITVRGVDNPTLANIEVGMAVVAVGRQRADGSLDAVELWAGAIGPGAGPGLGWRHGRGGGLGPWFDLGPWLGGPKASPTPTPGTDNSSTS